MRISEDEATRWRWPSGVSTNDREQTEANNDRVYTRAEEPKAQEKDQDHLAALRAEEGILTKVTTSPIGGENDCTPLGRGAQT